MLNFDSSGKSHVEWEQAYLQSRTTAITRTTL